MASQEHVVRSAHGAEVVRRERWFEGRFLTSYVLRSAGRETIFRHSADADEAWLMALGDAHVLDEPVKANMAAAPAAQSK